MDAQQGEFLTVAKAAEEAGCSKGLMYKLIRRRIVESVVDPLTKDTMVSMPSLRAHLATPEGQNQLARNVRLAEQASRRAAMELPLEEFWSTRRVAEEYGVSMDSVRRLISKGVLPAKRELYNRRVIYKMDPAVVLQLLTDPKIVAVIAKSHSSTE